MLMHLRMYLLFFMIVSGAGCQSRAVIVNTSSDGFNVVYAVPFNLVEDGPARLHEVSLVHGDEILKSFRSDEGILLVPNQWLLIDRDFICNHFFPVMEPLHPHHHPMGHGYYVEIGVKFEQKGRRDQWDSSLDRCDCAEYCGWFSCN